MNNTHVKLGLTQTPCSQRRRTAAFLRSFMEALIGDWEHLRERLHLETIGGKERDTQTRTHYGTQQPPP